MINDTTAEADDIIYKQGYYAGTIMKLGLYEILTNPACNGFQYDYTGNLSGRRNSDPE